MWVAKNINIFENILKKLYFVLWAMFSGKTLPFGTIYSSISILSSSQVSKLYFEINLPLPPKFLIYLQRPSLVIVRGQQVIALQCVN